MNNNNLCLNFIYLFLWFNVYLVPLYLKKSVLTPTLNHIGYNYIIVVTPLLEYIDVLDGSWYYS